MLTPWQAFSKRTFDVVVSTVGLLGLSWLIFLAIIIARWDTGASGLFKQRRIGRYGRSFEVLKIRTMRPGSEVLPLVSGENSPTTEGHWTTVTTSNDPRITAWGKFWRKTKIDELPQLINVFKGEMSLVGPRPDVPGFADKLVGDDRVILNMRPGITGPATLRYRHEEEILASVPDPEAYNREVIFPDKVRLNRDYVQNWSFWRDISLIAQTVLRVGSAYHTPLAKNPMTHRAPTNRDDSSRLALVQVCKQINKVLETSHRPLISNLEMEHRLQEDLGLDSLELAELTVRLEAEFGVDVFRGGMVRTAGEVVAKLLD